MDNHTRTHRLNCLVIVSAFWAGLLPAPSGYAQTCSQRIAHSRYGIGIDMNGNVWVPEHVSGILRKYSPDGSLMDTFNMQTSYNRGVAVTPVDNHIWVAHTGEDETDNRVTRYDALTGNLCEQIFLAGYGPSALAVDADGNVWVTSMAIADEGEPGLPAIARIVPASVVCDGAGQFLSSVDTYDIDQLEGGEDHPDGFAKPYNYSDMTGFVTLQTSATGTWTTVHDGGVYGAAWTMVTWIGHPSGTQPPGTSLAVAVRAADSEVELASASYQEGITSEQQFVDVWGRYIQVRVRFRGSCPGASFATPVLCDLQVSGSDIRDCNHNNDPDDDEIAADPTIDCNGNGIPDECEIDRNSIAPGWPFFCRGLCDPDCNGNGILDSCDADPSDPDGNGSSSADCNVNFIPDECEMGDWVGRRPGLRRGSRRPEPREHRCMSAFQAWEARSPGNYPGGEP